MDRRTFLQSLASGLAAATGKARDHHEIELGSAPDVALDRQDGLEAGGASPVRFIPDGPSTRSSWSAVCLGMSGLGLGERGFWVGEQLGEGWWSVKRLTTTGGTRVLYEPGFLFLDDRRVAQGQILRERDLDLAG